MISREQANAAASALSYENTDRSRLGGRKSARYRSKPMIGFLIGMAVGSLIGCAVCHGLTGRFTPGAIIGQGFGGAIGILIGLFVDGKASKRSKLLFWITAGVMAVLGALPFGLIHLMR